MNNKRNDIFFTKLPTTKVIYVRCPPVYATATVNIPVVAVLTDCLVAKCKFTHLLTITPKDNAYGTVWCGIHSACHSVLDGLLDFVYYRLVLVYWSKFSTFRYLKVKSGATTVIVVFWIILLPWKRLSPQLRWCSSLTATLKDLTFWMSIICFLLSLIKLLVLIDCTIRVSINSWLSILYHLNGRKVAI